MITIDNTPTAYICSTIRGNNLTTRGLRKMVLNKNNPDTPICLQMEIPNLPKFSIQTITIIDPLYNYLLDN